MKPEDDFISRLLPLVSNLVYVIPWLVAIIVENPVITVLAPLIFAASTIHHAFKPIGFWSYKRSNGFQKRLFLLDVLLTAITVIYLVDLFWRKGFPPTFWYSAALGLIALYFYSVWTKRYYKYGHSIWHTIAAIIITLAIL